jgi:hypothetical protein
MPEGTSKSTSIPADDRVVELEAAARPRLMLAFFRCGPGVLFPFDMDAAASGVAEVDESTSIASDPEMVTAPVPGSALDADLRWRPPR